MYRVNNRGVIRCLALREMRTNRRMSLVVILSIILTCVLFTALTTIGGSLINGAQQETMRQVGGSSMAGLKCVLPEDYERVISDSETKDVTYRVIVGTAENEDFTDIYVEVNRAGDDRAAEAMFCKPTTGRLPEKYDEIAVSTLVLDALGLPYELGIEIPITLNVDGEVSQHIFTLCGFWQGERVAMAQECWVSEAFADEYAPTPTVSYYEQSVPRYAGYYMVDFNYANSWDIEGKTDALIERLYGDSNIVPDTGINWAYVTSSIDSGTLIGGLLILLVIFVAGYLIIYNIFYINISTNIRGYGLLKTIGTTARQLRLMVRVRALVYSGIGIPLGLFIGTLLGRVLLCSIMRIINVYLAGAYTVSARLTAISCLLAAGFTFATVMISCRRPCRIAGNVTPVEALRYNDTRISGRGRHRSFERVMSLSLAYGNISRGRGKTALTVLSLSLSLILVNTLFTVLGGLDMEKFISHQMIGDFIITRDRTANYDDMFYKISPEQVEYLSEMDGADEVNAIYFAWGVLKSEEEPLERLNALCEKYADRDRYGELAAASEGEVAADVYGIPDTMLSHLSPISGELDLEKWKSGRYALIYTAFIEIEDEETKDDELYAVGDNVVITTNGTQKSYEVMAICDIPYALSTQRYHYLYGHVLIPDSEYFALSDNRNAMAVMINADEDSFDEVEATTREVADAAGSELILKSRQLYMDEYADFVNMIKLVGGTLAGILALIGMLNFINAVTTGILSRRRELAMMSAVGMTGGQLRTMLRCEGVIYSVFTGLCAVILGSLFSITAVRSAAAEMIFYTYRFTLVPIIVCIPILLLLSTLIPTAAYRSICSGSIVTRLREVG